MILIMFFLLDTTAVGSQISHTKCYFYRKYTLSITSEIIKNGLKDEVCLTKNTKIAFSRIGGLFILYISNL